MFKIISLVYRTVNNILNVFNEQEFVQIVLDHGLLATCSEYEL